jgi:hypothetical protein
MDEYEALLNEYAATVVERAQSNLRIKRRVRGKVVNRVASGTLLNSLTYKLRIRYNKPTIDFTVKGDAGLKEGEGGIAQAVVGENLHKCGVVFEEFLGIGEKGGFCVFHDDILPLSVRGTSFLSERN